MRNQRAPRCCTYPGCRTLLRTQGSRCPRHIEVVRRYYDQKRVGRPERGDPKQWSRASKRFLREHPLCQCPDCGAGAKRLTIATVVDHIIPSRGDMDLFWDQSNWQAMSKPCHDRKTATEDGGFGHRRKERA